MEVIIEEEVIGADEWHSVVAESHEAARRELALKVDEFLSNQGVIDIIPNGVIASTTSSFNGAVLTTNKAGRFSPDQVTRYARKRTEKKTKAAKQSDEGAVALLASMLDDAPTVTYMTEKLKCSHDLIQRLLADYFPDDSRADKFRRKERDVLNHENERALVEKIREALAAGMIGAWTIAKHCHSSYVSVKAANKKYKLGIPPGTPGRKYEAEL